jgi:hypothetical protein
MDILERLEAELQHTERIQRQIWWTEYKKSTAEILEPHLEKKKEKIEKGNLNGKGN